MEILRLASLTRLRPLSMQQLADIAAHASELDVPAGRRLLLAGPFSQELLLVATGRGSVRCAGEAVAELGPGDVLGALAAQPAAYPTATVRAIGDLRLVTFSSRDIRLLRERAPASLAALLAACGRAPSDPVRLPRLAVVHAAAA